MNIFSSQSSSVWLRIVALTGLAQLIGLLSWYWTDGLPFSTVSGVWIAHASDLIDGQFYRPLFAEDGYGGSHFMPLFFFLLSGFMELVGIPSTAGTLLTLLIGFCFVLGLIRLMQSTDVSLPTAISFSLLACFSISFQLLHLEVRGDVLASFLNLLALGFAIQGLKRPSPTLWVLMVLGFVLAWMTKFSMVYGWAAVSIYLILKGRSRVGCGLFLATASMVFLLWEIFQTASGGRLEAFLAQSFWGTGNLPYALKAPTWFLNGLLLDPFLVMILGAALWTLLILKSLRGTLVEVYFWVTLIGTIAMFTSPGVDAGHLIDLLAASLWVLACAWHENQKNRYPTRVILPLLMVGTLLTLLPWFGSIPNHFRQNGKPTFGHVEGIIKSLPWRSGEILSDNPLIPILMGRKPFLLDPLSLNRLSKKVPELGQDLFKKLEQQQFRAIILTHWSDETSETFLEEKEQSKLSGRDAFQGNVPFPEGFLKALKENYKLGYVAAPYYVFIPKSYSENLTLNSRSKRTV